jgi:hypothetical protein
MISCYRSVFLSMVIMSVLMWLPSTSYSQVSQRNILSNTASIKLPSSFSMMDANTLSSKYPPNNKPSEVYTNTEATVNIAFRKTEQQLINANVFTEGMKLQSQLVSSGKVQLVKSEQIKSGNNNIHVFSFYSDAIDTKVYNIMFVFSVKGKMVVGSFNCTSVLQPQWQQTAYEIIRSIKST